MSTVKMVKSQEKKCQNYFPMTMIILRCDVVKCNRTQEKLMCFDYCEEYIRSTSNKILLR